jgi:arginyl-tRNA synthetase
MFKPKTLPRLLLLYVNDRKVLYSKDSLISYYDASSTDLGRKKLVVEFLFPNISSEFHGKHLQSTVLGAYIANIHENMG